MISEITSKRPTSKKKKMVPHKKRQHRNRASFQFPAPKFDLSARSGLGVWPCLMFETPQPVAMTASSSQGVHGEVVSVAKGAEKDKTQFKITWKIPFLKIRFIRRHFSKLVIDKLLPTWCRNKGTAEDLLSLVIILKRG